MAKVIKNHSIYKRKARFQVMQRTFTGASPGTHLSHVNSTIDDLEKRDIISRIWRQDYTVWKPYPEEITDRLGWLTVAERMAEQVPHLIAFAREIREAGFTHVVLLGMGGSSLGPETLRQIFGHTKDYPELIVLDSTVPAWVQAVRDAIDIKHTLFLVSSKSGTTIETMSLYCFFRCQVDEALGKEKAGKSFVAITDQATPLEILAVEGCFLKAFLNPFDIGGRYSVLSYFGLVPAALAGIDITTLLERASNMKQSCAFSKILGENQGFLLGAMIGAMASKGVDKLTLLTSPSIASFGLWVEQLIAESTGKEGTGIIPIVNEPLAETDCYGYDRLFIYLRLKSDDNSDTDAALEHIKAAGHPVVSIEMENPYDLGAEFFRWEFATAVASAVLGINPFDQPNVQEAKEKTGRLLEEYVKSCRLPKINGVGSFRELLASARPGYYMAIMSYSQQTPDIDRALIELRRKLLMRYHIATTAGYGPRYLHSTGQLHKGGPANGLFLQLAARHERDLHILGQPYTLGVLTDAEALGDFQALRARKRPSARIDLGPKPAFTIQKLAEEVI